MKKLLKIFSLNGSSLADLCVKKGLARTTQEATLALLILAGVFINFAGLIYFAHEAGVRNQAAVVSLKF